MKIVYPQPLWRNLFVLALGLVLSACPQENDPQEEQARYLAAVLSGLLEQASAITCQGAAQWSFAPYGSKACGGPQGFLAYPVNDQTAQFLEDLEAYRLSEAQYNEDFGIASDCSAPATPIGVDCIQGSAVLIYP